MSAVLERPGSAPAGIVDLVMERLFPTPHPYVQDPIGYCRDVLGFDPWSKQREILEAVRDHRRVAVRSAHGVGKTAIAARAALWFIATRPGKTRVITTGASWTGVEKLLWPELHAGYHVAGDIGGTLTNTGLVFGDERFALGLSTDKPERFAGQHADHLLLIVDEASGVDERIFEAAAGYLTGVDAHMLLIGNPTQLAGEFHAAFHSKRHEYETISVSAFDTPPFTHEPVSDAAHKSLDGLVTYESEMRELYGKDSPVYQVRVLGEFPSTSDDTVCSLSAVEAARAYEAPEHRRVEPVVIGCDVARFGSDETVITVRHGRRVRIARRYVGRDTMQTAGQVLEVARQVANGCCPEAPAKTEPPSLIRIVVDDDGVGGGVTDRLREVGEFQVVPFNGGGSPWTDDYPNRRSELWFSFSERLATIDLDDDEQLAADLVAPRYKLDSAGRRVVEAKADTKKRLGRSPDRADGVMLTFAVPDRVPLPAVAQRPENRPITAGLMERQW